MVAGCNCRAANSFPAISKENSVSGPGSYVIFSVSDSSPGDRTIYNAHD